MVFKTEELQDSCKKIWDALDSSNTTIFSEVVHLKAAGRVFYLSVTNREYFVTVKLNLMEEASFEAVVDAKLFLNLINRITTDTIEVLVNGTTLLVNGNGHYKLPMIYKNDKLIELPEISINNETNSFDIKNEVLQSIIKYNSKEFSKNKDLKLMTKDYYIDNQGAVTYTSGACINPFTLDGPVKMILNEKLVRLLRLFNSENVHFVLAQDPYGSIIQTKVRFINDSITLTAITSTTNEALAKFPATTLRNLASADQPYSVTIDKTKALDCLERLSLFAEKEIYTLFTYITFTNSTMTIYDTKKENNETIGLISGSNIEDKYECIFDTKELIAKLSSCSDQYITINLGNQQSATLVSGGVKYLIPECMED